MMKGMRVKCEVFRLHLYCPIGACPGKVCIVRDCIHERGKLLHRCTKCGELFFLEQRFPRNEFVELPMADDTAASFVVHEVLDAAPDTGGH